MDFEALYLTLLVLGTLVSWVQKRLQAEWALLTLGWGGYLLFLTLRWQWQKKHPPQKRSRRRRKDEPIDAPPLLVLYLSGLILATLYLLFRSSPLWTWLIPGWGVGLLFLVLYGRNARRRAAEERAKVALTQELYHLSPTEFEKMMTELLTAYGYHVEHSGRAGDGGIDIQVTHPTSGKRAAIQCKLYKKKIGPAIVRELAGAMDRDNLSFGAVVSPGGFTQAAQQEATAHEGHSIALWDIEKIREMQVKYEQARRPE